jgi:hypothetical protein
MAEAGGGTDAWSRALRLAGGLADRVDARFAARSPATALTPGHPGVIPATWAALRLGAAVLAAPVAVPWLARATARNTARARALAARYPHFIRALATGDAGAGAGAGVAREPDRDRPIPAQRVRRAAADAPWFISSDLHRCVPGTVDWPRHQRTDRLYLAALDYYADRDWGLIENGDVEDFWLAGGSTYGVVYDVARLVAFALPGAAGRRGRRIVAAEQLRRIVANNRAVYRRIDERFHRHGRYIRIVGNHDDVYLDPATATQLSGVHAGLDVHDFLLLDDAAGGLVGVVTHGHHTDGWNGPMGAGMGRLGTWIGSVLLDLPRATSPGVPDPEETDEILGGRLRDVLMRIDSRYGANRDSFTLDEALLFEAWRGAWPGGREPWLVFGHTHVPLHRPLAPGADGTPAEVWDRYANSGAGIFYECVTGLEWDGTDAAGEPVVRLVAWRYADRDRDGGALAGSGAVVAWDGERDIVREVLGRVGSSEYLQVVARGHARTPSPAR